MTHLSHCWLILCLPCWFILVHNGDMSKKRLKRPAAPVKRFTITLDAQDYKRLVAIAEDHRPRLSLQYVVEYAIYSLLDQAQDPQFTHQLGNPLEGEKSNG